MSKTMISRHLRIQEGLDDELKIYSHLCRVNASEFIREAIKEKISRMQDSNKKPEI